MGIQNTLLLALLFGLASHVSVHAQIRHSRAGEKAAQEVQQQISGGDYNIRLGPVYLRSEASFGLELNDNVYRTDANESEDVILKPEVRLDALWPVTKMNALRLSLGIGYDYYIDNEDLNSDAPLVSPDTELAWNIFTGDFHIKLRERFSYQESLYIGSISPDQPNFINFNNTGKFRRLNNLIGASADWDLNDVIVSFGYDYECFDAMTQRFDYMDRKSHLFSTSAKFLPASKIMPGVELVGGHHDYETETLLHDHWRAWTGPFVEMRLSDAVQLRVGGGYECADFSGMGASDYDSYYAYGTLKHVVNKVFTHSLSAGRQSELGYNADTIRTTYVRYGTRWNIIKNTEISTRLSANFAKEFGGVFFEEFDYYRAGLGVSWQFHKHWRAVLDYSFLLKESEVALADFDQNRLVLAAAYQF